MPMRVGCISFFSFFVLLELVGRDGYEGKGRKWALYRPETFLGDVFFWVVKLRCQRRGGAGSAVIE